MSACAGSWSKSLDDSVRSLISNKGITVVVASGNSATDRQEVPCLSEFL